MHALLDSENPYFDENEMVFGKIAPGESKNFDLNVKVAKATLTRTDVIRASVFAQGQLQAEHARADPERRGQGRGRCSPTATRPSTT